MIEKRTMLLDVGSSTLQTVVAAIALFFLYRYLLHTLGPAELGVWSLVVATSSLVQVANFGLSGSIVKQVSDLDVENDQNRLAIAVETAVLSMAVLCLAVVLIAYPLGKWYLAFALDGERLKTAIHILPVALAAFWVMMVSSIYQGAMYGSQMILARNIILMAESVVYLGLSIWLAKSNGLVGLVWARLAQNLLTLGLTIFAIRRRIRSLSIVPYRWRFDLFKMVFSYASQYQIISLMVLFCDPITKGFLSRYGAVSLVGYYEMANKLIQQFRAIIAGANQVMVPLVARMHQAGASTIPAIYDRSYQAMFFIAILGFSTIGVAAPLISEVWLGRFEGAFVTPMLVLCTGWMLNSLGLPAYNMSLGSGKLRINLLSHLFMTILNVILCLAFGRYSHGFGVVIAWGISLAAGGLSLCALYHDESGRPTDSLLPSDSGRLLVTNIAGLVFAYLVYRFGALVVTYFSPLIPSVSVAPNWVISAAALSVYMLWMAIATRQHPVRALLFRWVRDSMRSKSGPLTTSS